MRNVDALRQALVRKRKRELGKLSPLPKTPEDVVRTGIPEIFTRTFSNEPFLRYVFFFLAQPLCSHLHKITNEPFFYIALAPYDFAANRP